MKTLTVRKRTGTIYNWPKLSRPLNRFYDNFFYITLKEVRRVLKKNGLFVFSLGHPMYNTTNSKTLKIETSYFEVGKKTFVFENYSENGNAYKAFFPANPSEFY